uniref:Uncharacterized protein n=1 Tax=Anopheles farauti TaxID=69004 RepID=A0A182QWT4_9DIPT
MIRISGTVKANAPPKSPEVHIPSSEDEEEDKMDNMLLAMKAVPAHEAKSMDKRKRPRPSQTTKRRHLLTETPHSRKPWLNGSRVLEEQHEKFHQENFKLQQKLAIYRADTKELAKLQASFMSEAAKPRSKRGKRTLEQQKTKRRRDLHGRKQQEQQQRQKRRLKDALTTQCTARYKPG